jgi:hypothetical protein
VDTGRFPPSRRGRGVVPQLPVLGIGQVEMAEATFLRMVRRPVVSTRNHAVITTVILPAQKGRAANGPLKVSEIGLHTQASGVCWKP